MTNTRKITDQLTYVTIERNGVAHTYHKTPSPNTRLSTAWDLVQKHTPAKRISYASYVRLHTLMMKQFVSTQGKTSVCYYQSRTVKPAPEPQTADYQAAVDNVWFEQVWTAGQIKSDWFVYAGNTRDDRMDYAILLEDAIARALGKRELGYRLSH